MTQACRILRVRWATWWPVPYWTHRFDQLASADGVELDVVFLSSSSKLLPAANQPDTWSFSYRYLRCGESLSGYSTVIRRFPRPWPLVEGSFDILVMPYADPDFVSAAVCCRLLGKRYCLFTPNNLFDQRKQSGFRERLKRFLYRGAAGVLATGHSQREYALQYVSARQPIDLVGNPAPPLRTQDHLRFDTRRTEVRQKLGWNGQFIVLFVGRLSEEKGLVTLLESMGRQGSDSRRVTLVLVGEGPQREQIEQQARSSGINVDFAGFLEGEALAERYLAADVFVLPSFSEPWGLVVNEAMEAELPVIVSDHVGAHQDLVVHGRNGYVFAAGDAEGLGVAIATLRADDNLRREMGRYSRMLVSAHSVEGWVSRVTAALNRYTSI